MSQAHASAYNGEFPGCKLRVVVFEAWEQMAIAVERHLDRAMSEQGLKAPRRETPLDRSECEEVPERVHAIFRLPLRVDDTSCNLQCIETPIRYIGMVLGLAVAVREDQP